MDDLPAAPSWRGVNHMALVTPDMDATVRFYTGVLGMPLVATVMAGPMRHYFFEIGPQNTVAFFEIEGAETFAKGAGTRGDRAIQFDHLSFNVADEHGLDLLRKRLLAAGSEVTEIVNHRTMKSVYFSDPHGIALEASYWVTDPTGREPNPEDRELFADPNPPSAVLELQAGGLTSVSTSRLV